MAPLPCAGRAPADARPRAASEAQALAETRSAKREAARQRARTERDVLGKPEPPPTIRFVGYNPRTGHTSILIVPSRAVAEVIEGGAHSLLLAPGKRFDLARAVSAQLHLEFPRNAPPELVLPWSEKQPLHIGAVKDDVNARAPRPPEERARPPERPMPPAEHQRPRCHRTPPRPPSPSTGVAAQAEAEAAAAAAAEAEAAAAAAAVARELRAGSRGGWPGGQGRQHPLRRLRPRPRRRRSRRRRRCRSTCTTRGSPRRPRSA